MMHTESSLNVSLLSLVPVKYHTSLNIRQYRSINRLAYNALLAFDRGNLEKFDGVAGDRSCHVQAVYLILRYKCTDFRNQVVNCINELEHDNNYLLQNIQSILELPERLIRSDVIILVWLYLLGFTNFTHTIRFQVDDQGNPFSKMYHVKYHRTDTISATMTKYMTSMAKREVSEYNIKFMINEATALYTEERREDLALICKENVRFAEQKRGIKYLPVYATMYANLERIVQECIPMLLLTIPIIVENNNAIMLEMEYSFFEVVSGTYERTQLPIYEEIAIIVESYRHDNDKDHVVDIKKMILANAADHCQYNNNEPFVMSALGESMKVVAKEEGYSKNYNPSNCVITHIYSGVVNKVRLDSIMRSYHEKINNLSDDGTRSLN
jgi:hypothetical protein